MNLFTLFAETDVLGKMVIVVLLTMSVLAWVLIVLKTLMLLGGFRRLQQSIAAFWQAADVAQAQTQVAAFDKKHWLIPLLNAGFESVAPQNGHNPSLAAVGDKNQRLTRVLRGALNQVLHTLQYGQIALATIGSTAPFVGLLGTVWGIYHALTSIGAGGQISIDKISAPVGEALIMTAVGLAVAIPAVLAYNIFGRSINRIEAELEGFARDLRDLLLDGDAASAVTRKN